VSSIQKPLIWRKPIKSSSKFDSYGQQSVPVLDEPIGPGHSHCCKTPILKRTILTQWWQQARAVARQLRENHGVQGVGVMGALVRDEPLNVWSRIQLVIWDVPEDVQLWHLGQSLPGKPPVEVIAAVRALPGEWEEIAQQMQVLEGEWQPCGPRPQERMMFHWKDE